MTLPHDKPDERGTARYFTIASSPAGAGEIMLTTRVIESTFKKTMYGLKKGESVEIFGPLGKFVLDVEDKAPKIFLAGEIGITPFHSMLVYASEKNMTTPLSLFVSFSKIEEMIFCDELAKLAESNGNIQVVYTITRAEGTDWTGETGRINEEMMAKYFKNYKDAEYFVTGPMAFVSAMGSLLEEMGIPEEHVKKEDFPGY